MGWDGMGSDGMGWDWMGSDGIGWDQRGSDGIGLDWIVWDGIGSDGMGSDEIRGDRLGWDGIGLAISGWCSYCSKLSFRRPTLFNIDCVDPLGRSGLMIAVENENIDVIGRW